MKQEKKSLVAAALALGLVMGALIGATGVLLLAAFFIPGWGVN